MKRLRSLLAILFYFFQKIKRALTPKRESMLAKRERIRKNENIIEHYQLLDDLKRNIGHEVVIQSKNLNHLYQNQIKNTDNKFRGKILEVDDEWIKLELYPENLGYNRGPDYLYFKTKVIVDFTLVTES